MTAGSPQPDPLAPVTELPGVRDAVERARSACEELRWHEAFRRRAREVRAEAGLQTARHSAAVDGARLTSARVRALATTPPNAPDARTDAHPGGRHEQRDDAGHRTEQTTAPADELVAHGAVRAAALVDSLAPELGARSAPQLPPFGQLLARLHAAVGADWLPPAELGRPRTADGPLDLRGLGPAPTPDEVGARLALLADVVARTDAPALVVAAVVHGELLALRPFRAGNGIVARAAARLLVTSRGLDPTGSVVPEAAWSPNPHVYVAAAARFATGEPEGVAGWVAGCADALVTGAARARVIADAVLAGRLPAD
ncbi:Fic family protein [Cellulomonas alba]|uniref:Fic family protein n=1 Tax=Cellulomonas alba TaxID=3053467 RepID=A0ABT7SE75_9CELL|nr:Fic family protein [Cellulomonas alba]MDM7854472.1 Fic family protein [Cellulomonas alba]